MICIVHQKWEQIFHPMKKNYLCEEFMNCSSTFHIFLFLPIHRGLLVSPHTKQLKWTLPQYKKWQWSLVESGFVHTSFFLVLVTWNSSTQCLSFWFYRKNMIKHSFSYSLISLDYFCANSIFVWFFSQKKASLHRFEQF